jgi:hypothetical protein
VGRTPTETEEKTMTDDRDARVRRLKALCCEDCLAEATVQRCEGIAGPSLAVVVRHDPSCPWFWRCVDDRHGVTMVNPDDGAILRHELKANDDRPV